MLLGGWHPTWQTTAPKLFAKVKETKSLRGYDRSLKLARPEDSPTGQGYRAAEVLFLTLHTEGNSRPKKPCHPSHACQAKACTGVLYRNKKSEGTLTGVRVGVPYRNVVTSSSWQHRGGVPPGSMELYHHTLTVLLLYVSTLSSNTEVLVSSISSNCIEKIKSAYSMFVIVWSMVSHMFLSKMSLHLSRVSWESHLLLAVYTPED